MTVSVALSKVLELYILDQCGSHHVSSSQFGFVEKRGTDMAIALAHDVTSYCVSKGSSVFACSLDAEMAFDGLPHEIIFLKTMDIIPPNCWKLMYMWYSKMVVFLKWAGISCQPIPVEVGTRQGGLTSPFVFNLFYADMINKLDNMTCGITINNTNYSVFAYADDILLLSTTASGLQKLIDIAGEYLVQHGLQFNPSKSHCMISGGNPFISVPT